MPTGISSIVNETLKLGLKLYIRETGHICKKILLHEDFFAR